MATKTYTINGAGQRLKYSIPFAHTPDSSNKYQSKPGGTLETSGSSGRIGTTTNGKYEEKKGAIAHVMRYQFTTSADPASKTTLTSLKWTGSFSHVDQGESDADLSVPRCLITTIDWPEEDLDIWGYDTKYGKVNSGVITISGNTAITSGDVPIYDANFNPCQLESNTTYYIFVFDNYGYPQNWGERIFKTESGSLVVTTEVETYTNIGKPSDIKAEVSYVKPGGSLTVTWTKAAGDVSNPVKDYTLVWKVGSHSETITGITKTSYDIKIPNDEAIRGASISCSVQAIPTQSGYGSEAETNGAIAKINRKPNKPTVTPTTTTLPSTGGQVTFTLSGSDPDGQNISFKCNGTTFAGSVIKISEIKETKAFSFQINDGLEDGEAVEVEIKVNSKPDFNINATIDCLTARFDIKPLTGRESDYTYILDYNGQSKALGTTKELSYTIDNIRDCGVPAETSFSFRVIRNDGIETYEKTQAGSTTPKLPVYEGINHSSSFSNSNLQLYFDNKMLPLFSDVEYFNQIRVSVEGNQSQIYSISEGNPNWYINLSETTLSLFTRGAPKKMTMTFGRNENFFTQYSFERSYTRVLNTIANLKMSDFNLFNGTPGLSFAFDDSQYLLYGIESGLKDRPREFILSFKKGETSIGELNAVLSSSNSSSNVTFFCQIDGSSLYNSLKDNLKTEGEHNVELKLSFNNDVGGTSTGETNLTITRSPLVDNPATPVLWAEEVEATQWNYLLQGMEIKNEEFQYRAYANNLVVQFYIQRGQGRAWEKYGPLMSSTNTKEVTYGEPLIHSFSSKLLSTIGPVSSDYEPKVKVQILTQGENSRKDSGELTLPIVKHLIPPTISILSGIYNADGIVKIGCKITKADENWGNNIKAKIGEKEINVVLKDGYISFDGTEFFNGKDSISIQLKASSTTTVTVKTGSKTFYGESDYSLSNSYRVFNIMPTISYRKNRLGINSKIDSNEDSTTVLKISPVSDTTLIRLLTTEDREITINLSDGTITGLIIDSGSW